MQSSCRRQLKIHKSLSLFTSAFQRRTKRELHGRSETEHLDGLLHQQVLSVTREAISSGKVNPDKIEGIRHLTHLIDVNKHIVNARQPQGWSLITAFAMTIAIVCILLFVRVASTQIELNASLSGIAFDMPSGGILLEDLKLASLTMHAVDRVRLGDKEYKGSNVQISSVGSKESNGYIVVSEVRLRVGSQVELVSQDEDGIFSLSIRRKLVSTVLPDKISVDLTLIGPLVVHIFVPFENAPLAIEIQGGGPEQVNVQVYESAARFELKTLTEDPQGEGVPMAPRTVQAANLSFWVRGEEAGSYEITELGIQNEEEYSSDTLGQAENIRESSILSGELYLEDVNRTYFDVRPTDLLRVEGSEGRIWGHALQPEGVYIRYHGTVTDIRRGMGEGESLMPTLFQWLAAEYPVSIILAVGGIVFAVFRYVLNLNVLGDRRR